jgi:hypothetical protein
MTNSMLLPALRAWVRDQQGVLAAEEFVLRLDDSRVQWQKGSMTLALDGPDALGQLTVWDTGEAELHCAAVATGHVFSEHRQLASVGDLHQALAELVRRLRSPESK